MSRRRVQSILGPPDKRPWVWLETEMLASPAWRALSINARRLIDFLLIEHRNHAGRENGKLRAPYRQLQEFGLTAELIRPAIDEAERLGFVRSTALGFEVGRLRRRPSGFRLTFIAGSTESPISPPTNEWRAVNEIQKAASETRGRLHRKHEAELPRKYEAAPKVVHLRNCQKRNQINGNAK